MRDLLSGGAVLKFLAAARAREVKAAMVLDSAAFCNFLVSEGAGAFNRG